MLVSASLSTWFCMNACVCAWVTLFAHAPWPFWRSQLSDGRPRVAMQAGTASHHNSTLNFTFSLIHLYRLLSPLSFSSRLSSFPCCHIPPTCFLPLLFPSHFYFFLPPPSALHPSLHLLYPISLLHCLHFISQRSITSQEGRHKEKGNEQFGICWQTH